MQLCAPGVVPGGGDARAREEVEQRRLPALGQPDQSDLHEIDYSGTRAHGHRPSPPRRPLTASRRDIDVPGAALALLVSILWGANPVAVKLGLEDAPPLRLAWMRFVVGGGVILGWAAATGRLREVAVARQEWRPLVVLGLLFTAQVGGMNVGTALTSAAHAAIILNLYAVHTVVLAHFMIPGDRLTVHRVAGVVVAYSGIVVLFARQAGGAVTLLGDGLMFVSGLLLAERTVYMARAVQTLEPVKLLLAQAAIGSALFMVLSAVFEPAPTRWTPTLAASIGYQGVVVAGFNFVVNLWLLKHYRPSTLAVFFLTQPVFGVVAAMLVAGDRLTPELLAACLAVAAGIGLASR
ncbi:MAG TPA: DMT family transporter [Methylomirabilota bacterium]|nr:DMT family transporter [Methylomirabilota bacterium]